MSDTNEMMPGVIPAQGRGVVGAATVASNGMLAQMNRVELDAQIATARAYPRSIRQFKEEMFELATLDEETAASCFYALPRGGKTIEGPSVRLAEIAASCWGHFRYGGRIVEVGDSFIVAQGFAHDVQRNVASTVEVRRRITDKNGNRYNEDMIAMTGMAAISLAKRNAVFSVVPFALVKGAYDEAKKVSLGKALTMSQRRERVLGFFQKLGATPADVCHVVGVKGPEDLGIEELTTLVGLRQAIKDGDTTWEAVKRAAEPETPKAIDVAKMFAGKTEVANGTEPKHDAKAEEPAKVEPKPAPKKGGKVTAEEVPAPPAPPKPEPEPGPESDDLFS